MGNTEIKTTLYDPEKYHDSCGTGFIARISGEPSHEIVTLAIEALKRLTHRGAKSADSRTGDGSGILTDIPRNYFQKILKQKFDYTIKPDETLAIGVVFTNRGKFKRLEKSFAELCRKYESKYIGYRNVPVNHQVLGETARKTCPGIVQFFMTLPASAKRNPESHLYLLRRAIENKIKAWDTDSFICSLSSKTIVYKGLMSANQIDQFYPDLTDPDYIARLALFHERFSTNTNPSWNMAQPFRMIAHNGEINTIKGNRLWSQSREKELRSSYWNSHLDTLKPIVSNSGSDSFSLDNAFEFLSRSGRSMFHSIMMLIPEPYNDRNFPPALRDFYIYHENYMEPWDGPAAVVFTDGDFVGAKLDRNGLRPLRYSITKDGLVIMASEAGVVDIADENLVVHHHMTSGEIFGLALDGGGIIDDRTIKTRVASGGPYSELIRKNFMALERGDIEAEFGDFALPAGGFDKRLRRAFGWSLEDLSHILVPMANTGQEPIGSMGNDTPPAVLSSQYHRLYDYFQQSFAQVTNPPIDPIREKLVTSLSLFLGSEENLLAKEPRFNGAIKLESPVLSPREIRVLMQNHDWFPHKKILCHIPLNCNFEEQLQRIKRECAEAIENGCKLIFLSDENLNETTLPIPMALMVSAVHHYLSEQRIRSRVSLICITGDVVEDHHVACLIGMGASAVYPYMAYELIREYFADEDWAERMGNYRRALEKGLLKIMSKMGISTVASYHGSMLFHAIGLSQKLIKAYMPSIECVTSGIGIPQIRQYLMECHKDAFGTDRTELEDRGFFRHRKNGEQHAFSPDIVKQIRKVAVNASTDAAVNRKIVHFRDVFSIKSKSDIPLKQVEPATDILARFGCSAMSFGSISDGAHRVLAKGMTLIGGRSNTGEGGEPPDRYAHSNPDLSANSHTKQVASGRFGVTVDYLAAAQEIQIKIAQGAKPGEGGQLPGHKVSVMIAQARSSTPGVQLISPPPHHDIYSIEDIAQLIFDLKQVNPRVPVSVKLVAQPGVGTVACGVVKAGADIVLISGADGGTGAAPMGSQKHVGFPWEIGLAETHQALTANRLRDRVILRVDGGLIGARDVIIAALLGAEEYDFGTAALIAIGCIMDRKCHLNTCRVGIATQDERLQKLFRGKPEHIRNYFNAVALNIRKHLSEMGAAKMDDIIGRSYRLKLNPALRDFLHNRGVDLSGIIHGNHDDKPVENYKTKVSRTSKQSTPHFDDSVIDEVRTALLTHGQAVVTRKVSNTDRSIGTRMAGELARLFDRGNFKGLIRYKLDGVAGQSLGAFLCDGIELNLRGVANDYVGKGMSGGLIAIRLPKMIRQHEKNHTIIGNVTLYGATGGTLFAAGRAGERFAVRNSGATAVVEGVGNHCCEYMTRGIVIVLGETGNNFGAGMTGGVAYLYRKNDHDFSFINTDYVRMDELNDADYLLLHNLIRRHHFFTRSVTAEGILNSWESEKKHLRKILPLTMDTINFRDIYNQQIHARLSGLLNN